MGAWKRCDTCRKVLPADSFTDDGTTCVPCQAGPPPRAPRARASAVTTTRVQATAPAPRVERVGVVGSGDLEVRERRARKTALEQLAELHAEEYESLLQLARRAEGLRA